MISIIIPTYNRKELLRKCLNSIWNCILPSCGYEVVVVDDGSSDGTLEYLKQESLVRANLVVLSQNNSGPATARNAGAKKAKGDILAFTDDDCVVSAQWLSAIEEGMLSNKYLALEGPVKSDTYKNISPLTHIIEHEGPKGFMTCNLTVKKNVFEQIGGFDENFMNAAHEDVDLCLRVLKFGEIGYVSTMEIIHPARRYNWLKEIVRSYKYAKGYVYGEYLLYKRNPNLYKTVRYRNSFLSTLIHLSFVYGFQQSKRPLKMIIKHPLEYLGLLTIQLTKQFWIFIWFCVKMFSVEKIKF